MNQTRILKKILILFIFGSLLAQLSACGWILHPERRGQSNGHIDAGIAILDVVGLLFFLIPGIIAFALDFSTGCIYLPGNGFSAVAGDDEIRVVKIDPAELSEKAIKDIVDRETGLLGKIIGKQGRTASAMRTILRAVSAKTRRHTVLDIIE